MYNIFDESNKERLGAELFEEGDMVYIHPEIEETDKGDAVADGMVKYAGKAAMIVIKHSDNYELDIDGGEYVWDDFMLMSEDEFNEYYNQVEPDDILGMLS